MTSGGVYACRVGAIDLRVDDKEIILINTLVLHAKPLEFDLLVGIDTKHLEGCPFHHQMRCGYSERIDCVQCSAVMNLIFTEFN